MDTRATPMDFDRRCFVKRIGLLLAAPTLMLYTQPDAVQSLMVRLLDIDPIMLKEIRDEIRTGVKIRRSTSDLKMRLALYKPTTLGELIRAFFELRENDFARGSTTIVRGWVLADCEVQAILLAASTGDTLV
jgi:hypothetical protein